MRNRLLVLLAFVLMSMSSFAGSRSDHFSYVFSNGDKTHMMSRGNIDEIVRLSKKYEGTYIWFRRDGREYLVRDAATLAAAKDAFRDLDALEPQEREAERCVRPYEKKMDELEKQVDRISDQLSDDEDLSESQREELESQMHDFEREMKGVERDMESAEREVERIDREEERLEKIAERKFQEILMQAVQQGKVQRLD